MLINDHSALAGRSKVENTPAYMKEERSKGKKRVMMIDAHVDVMLTSVLSPTRIKKEVLIVCLEFSGFPPNRLSQAALPTRVTAPKEKKWGSEAWFAVTTATEWRHTEMGQNTKEK